MSETATTAPAKPVVPALPRPSFAGAFQKAEQVGPPKSIMLYGAPGTRKTTIAGGIIKVPGFNRVLYIDVDNGTEVFANDAEVIAAVRDGRIDILPIDKRDPQAFHKLNGVIDEVVSNDFQYDAVVLDAADVAQEIARDYLLANTFNEKGQLDTRAGWSEISKWTADKFWAFQNTKHFVGITVVHQQADEEKNGALVIKPKFQGSVKDNVAGIPSLVANLTFQPDADPEKPAHLVASLGGETGVITKNRYSFSEPIVDFDLPTLYRIIAEKTNPTAAPATA